MGKKFQHYSAALLGVFCLGQTVIGLSLWGLGKTETTPKLDIDTTAKLDREQLMTQLVRPGMLASGQVKALLERAANPKDRLIDERTVEQYLETFEKKPDNCKKSILSEGLDFYKANHRSHDSASERLFRYCRQSLKELVIYCIESADVPEAVRDEMDSAYGEAAHWPDEKVIELCPHLSTKLEDKIWRDQRQ